MRWSTPLILPVGPYLRCQKQRQDSLNVGESAPLVRQRNEAVLPGGLLLLLLLLLHVFGRHGWWFLRLLDQQRPLLGNRKAVLEFRRINRGRHSNSDRQLAGGLAARD